MGPQVTSSEPVSSERRFTRDRLVDTALKLFHEHGYQATGVARILKEAGVRSGSLYYFFPRKADLLLAVLHRYREMLYPVVLRPAFDRTNDPIERVFAVLEGYRNMLIESKFTSSCPIASIALEMGEKSEEVRALVVENFEGWRSAIQECLDAVRGGFPEDVELRRLSSFLLTVMEGAVLQSRAHHDIGPFDDAVRSLRDMFGRMMEADSGGTETKGT